MKQQGSLLAIKPFLELLQRDPKPDPAISMTLPYLGDEAGVGAPRLQYFRYLGKINHSFADFASVVINKRTARISFDKRAAIRSDGALAEMLLNWRS
jgi:hypothetical protein